MGRGPLGRSTLSNLSQPPKPLLGLSGDTCLHHHRRDLLPYTATAVLNRKYVNHWVHTATPFFFLCGCVKFQSNVDNKSHRTSRFATGPDADVAQTVNAMCPYASILTAAIYAEEQCANHQPKGALQCHIGVFEAHAGLFPIAKKSIKCRGIAYCDQQLMRTHSRCRSGNCAIRCIFKAARAVNLKVMQCGIGPCNHDDDTQIILRFFV